MNDFDKYINHIIDTEFYAQEREEFTKKKLLFLKRKLLNILKKNQTIGDKRKFNDTLRQLDKITDEEIDKLTKELEEERKQQIQKEDKYLRRLIGSALLASSFLSVYNADKILNAKFNSKDNFKSFKKNLKSNFKKAYTTPLNIENHFGGNTSHAENTVSRNIDRLINYAASDVHTMTTATQRDTYKAVIHNSGLKLQYVAMLDSHLCPVCGSLHGQVFNEDEAPDVPLHERCRCVLVHVKGNGYQLRDFDEWLKRQPNEVQEKILGKTRYAMYKSGYISKVSQFTSKNRLMTLDELFNENKTGGSILEKSEDEQLRHANMYYESIRNRKSKSDVNTIAKNTNMPKEKINAIREHIFYSNSNKTLSGEFKPFDADIDIALAWQRLEQNKFTDIDIMLLNHEYLELSIMKEYNYDYKKAHFIADLDYPWEFYTKRHLKEVPRDNIYSFIQNILKSLL